MIELLRNCLHGGEVATYLVTNESVPRHVLKVSTTPSGIKYLQAEFNGWRWYQERRYAQTVHPVCRIIQQKDNYIRIQMEYIAGYKPDYKKGLERNSELLRKIVEHYSRVWPYHTDDMVPLHGDFSLDNIIYNSEGIHIIDWEHFNFNGGPWGFDIIYLLFESLFFSMKHRKKPSLKEIKIVAENINFLNSKNRLSSEMIENPLLFIRDFIRNNPELWGEQLKEFQNKLPVIAFTEKQISLIDNLVCSELKG